MGDQNETHLTAIHELVLKELDLDNAIVTISWKTIKSRLAHCSLSVDKQNNKITALRKIEPVLVQVAIWKQEAGQPTTAGEGLELANLLIAGTAIQAKLKEFQRSIKARPTGFVSSKFWVQFIIRHM